MADEASMRDTHRMETMEETEQGEGKFKESVHVLETQGKEFSW